MNELVSICVPTYNGEKYLVEALDSILNQIYRNIEVIISDDASNDNTLEICQNFKNNAPFPVSIFNHTPSGIGANWNNAINNSNGEYIKLMFQDDVMMPDCVEIMMNELLTNKLSCVISKRVIINEHSKPITSGPWYQNFNDLQKPAAIESQEKLYLLEKKHFKYLNLNRIIRDNIIGEPCVSLFTRKLYKKIGPFSTSLKQILDYEYWLRILKHYKIGIINKQLIAFRVHDQQASNINSVDGVSEAGIIRKIIYSKFILHIGRKERMYYFHQKFPVIKNLAAFKNQLLGRK